MAITTGTRLGSYELIAHIGAGGMGEVYKAHDTKLGRDVAIKILPEGFAHDHERLTRFQREGKMLASLNHPNIATIYGLEHSDGTHFLIMELVAGENLAERIKRERAFPVEEALTIAVQISEALEAAHEKGIIHRDLKPANVKVTPEGRVKVLDFGLAKAFAGDGALDLTQAPTLSEKGRILGTPAYMSPEQARGKAVDKRTDIWAFGCLLYELLTGRQPFRGDTLSDTIAAILERDPDWQALPHSTPAKVRELLRRCLQKDIRLRLRDFGDARIELQEGKDTVVSRPWWRSKGALALGAVILAILIAAGVTNRFTSLRSIDSVAVLPFVNATGDPNAEYLSDGITENLINSLSELPHLKVMSRDSAFMYKGKETDARTAGQALGVHSIFKGRVMQHGETLSISTELIDARDSSHIGGQQYNRKRSDIFTLQGEIAKDITSALRTRLTGEEERRLAKSYTPSPEVYQLYLQGSFWSNKNSPDALNKAIGYFQQAISKDPAYALAYAGLSLTYMTLASNEIVPPREAFPKAEDAALKALALDDTLAEAHHSLAQVKAFFEWDWSGSEKEYQRALALKPNYTLALRGYGGALRAMGRMDEAIAEFRRGLEIDPLSTTLNGFLGQTLYMARHYDEAIEQEQKTLELEPNFIQAHYYLGIAYLHKSMFNEGIAEFKKASALSPGFAYPMAGLGYAYAVSGRRAEAQKVIAQLDELSKQKYVFAASRAIVYAGLGEKDKTFEWLDKAYQERALGNPEAIKVEPVWDRLRSDPRFADLLRRMNLQ